MINKVQRPPPPPPSPPKTDRPSHRAPGGAKNYNQGTIPKLNGKRRHHEIL